MLLRSLARPRPISVKGFIAPDTSCLQLWSPSIQTRKYIRTTEMPVAPARRAALSYHWDTVPPSINQLKAASQFFQNHPPQFMWSAEQFKRIPFGDGFEVPEICFLGRSNVGKSSLLNILLCQKIAHTSSKPGRTRMMNAFAVGEGKKQFIVMDMPGYGKGGRSEWGEQIMKYLEKRRQLKRAFLLVDSEHGMKATDMKMLQVLKQVGVPFQVILSKVDKVLNVKDTLSYQPTSQHASPKSVRKNSLQALMTEVKDAIHMDLKDYGQVVGEILACSSKAWLGGLRMGINQIRFATLNAVGLEYVPKKAEFEPQEIIPYDKIMFATVPKRQKENNFSDKVAVDAEQCKDRGELKSQASAQSHNEQHQPTFSGVTDMRKSHQQSRTERKSYSGR